MGVCKNFFAFLHALHVLHGKIYLTPCERLQTIEGISQIRPLTPDRLAVEVYGRFSA